MARNDNNICHGCTKISYAEISVVKGVVPDTINVAGPERVMSRCPLSTSKLATF